jgi:hypothetical protein
MTAAEIAEIEVDNIAKLFAAFALTAHTEQPSKVRGEMATRYTTAMWGQHQGIAAFAAGRPFVDASGKYRHSEFGQRFYNWPADAKRCIAEQLDICADGKDVYVNPMLRTAKRRQKDTGAGGRWAWVDLDGPLTDARKATLAGLGDACRLISSGTGHHAYVQLDEWRTWEQVETINQGLAHALDGDHKWSNESLLRLPGTFNLKPLILRNEEPRLVQAVTL